MNYDESIDVIAAIMRRWEKAKDWSDEHAEQWVTDLAPLDFKRAVVAVADCHQQHHYPPSWAQFHEAYRLATFRELDPSRNPPTTRALEPGYLSKAENGRRMKVLREMLKVVTSPAPHNHHPRKVRVMDDNGDPALDEHGDERFETLRGPFACPVCSLHDRDDQGMHKPEHCARCKRIGNEIYEAIRGEA